VLPAAAEPAARTTLADKGSRSPAASYTFGGDYLATPKLIMSTRGGYNYTNYKDYAYPSDWNGYVSSKTIVDAGGVARARGLVPAGKRIVREEHLGSLPQYLTSCCAAFAGHHTIKAGWEINRLYNSPNRNTYPTDICGSIGTTYTESTGTKMKGQYGYLRYRTAQSRVMHRAATKCTRRTTGRSASGLTLLLGLRTEREFVLSFAVASTSRRGPSNSVLAATRAAPGLRLMKGDSM
jgi:hypothetical protein